MDDETPVPEGFKNAQIESMLSARLFLVPQIVGERVFFVSNLSGHLSLYAMDKGGSVPEPLIPPDVVLQNPVLMGGHPYYVFPKLGKILLMLDNNGDENYQPMFVPIEGGRPEAIHSEVFANQRVHMATPDLEGSIVYFVAESRSEQLNTAFQVDLGKGSLLKLAQSKWGSFYDASNKDHTKVVLIDGYTAGDHVLYLWEREAGERRLLYGKPIEARSEEEVIKPNGISSCHFTDEDRRLVFLTFLFEDTGGLGTLDLEDPSEVRPVPISGTVHAGDGELEDLEHIVDDRYLLTYNIDGCTWLYGATLDAKAMEMRVDEVLCGKGEFSNGVLESQRYDREGDTYALSFSTATSPTQIYTLEGRDRKVIRHTRERILGIPREWLSAGEDASYTSFDGMRVSVRLYLPASELGHKGPYPLIYYVHGGPQSQERPDFAWFSMPLIQFLTIQGFAVFVPNVRGSTGYGMRCMKQVDRDWGGKDRLDHVHAMTAVLPKEKRVDLSRAGVVGRSYGGYMTLTLAGRHPDLWSAACDMFGPYDLVTFMDRIPETWKPFFAIAVGDPQKDLEFLTERSPRTHIEQMRCPLLVIQGKNDPRVIEQESRDLVEHLRGIGKEVDYLMFEDEGHDVLKLKNRVRCYNEITAFFKKHLRV